jgi:hypothetical protein
MKRISEIAPADKVVPKEVKLNQIEGADLILERYKLVHWNGIDCVELMLRNPKTDGLARCFTTSRNIRYQCENLDPERHLPIRVTPVKREGGWVLE